jgi:hypothetical protein
MADVRAVDHHAAEQHELGQRRPDVAEPRAQIGGIEGHRLEHSTSERRARERREIVRVIGIGAEPDHRVVLQKIDHLRRSVQEGRRAVHIEPVADGLLQIGERLLEAVIARRAVSAVRDPDRSGRTCRGPAHELGLLDQQHS